MTESEDERSSWLLIVGVKRLKTNWEKFETLIALVIPL